MTKEIFKLYKVAERKSRNKFYQYFNGDKLFVSNLGRCKINDKIVEPCTYNKYGHRCFGGEPLHRIVYALFVGEIPKGMEIDHIDTNPSNNCVDNLRVCTHKENNNNPLSIKHKSDAQKGKHLSDEHKKKISESNPNRKSVLQHTKNLIFVKEFEGVRQAERETKIRHIGACCRGNRKSAGGFIWKYKQ